jgi:3-dehydroquinate dehydratase-1
MICVALADMSYEQCLERVQNEAFVEFRFDLLNLGPIQVSELVRHAKRSIATFRPPKADTGMRRDTLILAMQSGADYLDIELEAETSYRDELLKEARKQGTEVIVSHHDFDRTPPATELRDIAEACSAAGADVIKIACRANTYEDNRVLMAAYRYGKRMVVIGMGEMGRITRVAAPFLGAEFTFAAPDEGLATAPGQLSRTDLQAIIEMIRK